MTSVALKRLGAVWVKRNVFSLVHNWPKHFILYHINRKKGGWRKHKGNTVLISEPPKNITSSDNNFKDASCLLHSMEFFFKWEKCLLIYRWGYFFLLLIFYMVLKFLLVLQGKTVLLTPFISLFLSKASFSWRKLS